MVGVLNGPLGADTGVSASGSTSLELLQRARAGDRRALEQLFSRMAPALHRWAKGRLPRWARTRADTGDLVQDALAHAFGRLPHFEPRQRQALRAYLRQAVVNRVRDEVRWAGRRVLVDAATVDLTDPGSAFDSLVDEENGERYRSALRRLDPAEQELIVARLELGYSYEQMAIATGRRTPDAARVAVRRALLRLAEEVGPA